MEERTNEKVLHHDSVRSRSAGITGAGGPAIGVSSSWFFRGPEGATQIERRRHANGDSLCEQSAGDAAVSAERPGWSRNFDGEFAGKSRFAEFLGHLVSAMSRRDSDDDRPAEQVQRYAANRRDLDGRFFRG